MEFVEAMGAMKRMCKDREGCLGCPLSKFKTTSFVGCMNALMIRPEETEAILTIWNAEHPLKTLKDVFNEAFPNAPKCRTRAPDIPAFCVSKVGYTPICQSDECCESNCIKCWNRPYNEPEK